MSKPFDYSKWDNIELSDDEEDCHPNIEKESWFRMKHRSRVEREENEEADKKKINQEMRRDQLRIDELTSRIEKMKGGNDGSDDELEDEEGMNAEIKELAKKQEERQAKLDHYEKNKKWNVDNMCTVTDEKTYVNPSASEPSFDASGYALPPTATTTTATTAVKEEKKSTKSTESAPLPTPPTTQKPTAGPSPPPSGTSTSTATAPKPNKPKVGPVSEKETVLSYADFTSQHEDLLEKYCNMTGMEAIKTFLLQNGTIMLQEHASSYLLLSCLEDEMNGQRDKMKITARNSQVLTNIAELAKSLKKHPGNVIIPFFARVGEASHASSFQEGVDIFIERIIKRAVEKRKEMDAEEQEVEEVDLSSLPKEERLGPGGLDPIEVFESLPKALQEAFESREMDQLREALVGMTPEDAKYHMKRCEDSGLWNAA
ncbi:hypothetical protein TrST_g3030 [Triparma strigata]|uniref:Hsp90 chaperone protein kinase-targeting subunit n=1 Tax=Triparma strigata TaxID=1606541 RepID=A0A9W6ZUC1_9STRA|nr:hypothetical protein TrST_g3030 [Triparma strigata]